MASSVVLVSSSPLEEREMFFRLCRLLLDGGTKILREELEKIIYPSDVPTFLQQEKANIEKEKMPRFFTLPMRRVLYPSGNTYGKLIDFDITLLIAIFRNTSCRIKPPPSTKNWIDKPLDSDHSPAADIRRLQLIRNQLFSHAPSCSIPRNDFEQVSTELRDILIRRGGPQWIQEVDILLGEPLTQSEQAYESQLQYWHNYDADVREILQKVDGKIDQVSKDIAEIGEYIRSQSLLGTAEAQLPRLEKDKVPVYIAMCDYVATRTNELTIHKSDRLAVTNDDNYYWWFVRTLDTDKKGYIPSFCVRSEMPDEFEMQEAERHRAARLKLQKEKIQTLSSSEENICSVIQETAMGVETVDYFRMKKTGSLPEITPTKQDNHGGLLRSATYSYRLQQQQQSRVTQNVWNEKEMPESMDEQVSDTPRLEDEMKEEAKGNVNLDKSVKEIKEKKWMSRFRLSSKETKKATATWYHLKEDKISKKPESADGQVFEFDMPLLQDEMKGIVPEPTESDCIHVLEITKGNVEEAVKLLKLSSLGLDVSIDHCLEELESCSWDFTAAEHKMKLRHLHKERPDLNLEKIEHVLKEYDWDISLAMQDFRVQDYFEYCQRLGISERDATETLRSCPDNVLYVDEAIQLIKIKKVADITLRSEEYCRETLQHCQWKLERAVGYIFNP